MPDRLYTFASAGFEAARSLPAPAPARPAPSLHGHSFRVRVWAALPPGWAPFAGAEADALAERLAAGVAPLDYGLLNEHLPVPTDLNLVHWVRQHLAVPAIAAVRLHGTPAHGVTLTAPDQVGVWHRFQFEAAHRLPNVPAGHPCGRLHGHSFRVVLQARGTVDSATPVLTDRLAAGWTPLQAQLHWNCLNEIPGLSNPTSEVLAAWLWQRLQPDLPELSGVSVRETATAGCHYDGQHYRIWKGQRFESALRLGRAPVGDPRRRLHGHSYAIRLHLTAPLDAVLGWTVDFGDVKALFQPLYQQLDHHRLDELAGLDDAAPAELLYWLRERLGDRLSSLDRLDLEPTSDSGMVLCWGARLPVLAV